MAKVGELKDREEENNHHSIPLAIHSRMQMLIIRKDYFNKPRAFYHYNVAKVKLSVGDGDKTLYPMVHDALMSLADEDRIIKIIFNSPKEHWRSPPNNGNFNNGVVRVYIESQSLLKRFYEVCGYQLTISLYGFIYRNTYQSGLRVPLTSDGNNLVFNINEDGTTDEKTVEMSPGLLGLYECTGIFTVTLGWLGPKPILQGGKLISEGLKWTFPDIRIIARESESYACHSELLSALSPVFDAMLNSYMNERATKEIRLKDSATTIEAFLKYAYDGSFHQAYSNSDLCYKLYAFGHIYHIPELEDATKDLLEGKSATWLKTKTALNLFCFANCMNDGDTLVEKVGTLLKSRQEEVIKSPEFLKLSKVYPQLLKQEFSVNNKLCGDKKPPETLLHVDEELQDYVGI